MARDYTQALAAVGDELRGYVEQLAKVPDERAAAMCRELERAIRFAPEAPKQDASAAAPQSLNEQAQADLDDDDQDDDDNDGA